MSGAHARILGAAALASALVAASSALGAGPMLRNGAPARLGELVDRFGTKGVEAICGGARAAPAAGLDCVDAVVERADGFSLWTAAVGGAEEWLLLEPSGEGGPRLVSTYRAKTSTWGASGNRAATRDGAIVASAPVAFGEDGTTVPLHFVARGAELELWAEAPAHQALLVDPYWAEVGKLTRGHYLHTATLLRDGRVLVAGGALEFQCIGEPGQCTSCNWSTDATAEILSPPSFHGVATTPMPFPRANHAAVLMDDGRVMVVGGVSSSAILTSAIIFDPKTEQWSNAASLREACLYPTLFNLHDSGGRLIEFGCIEGDIELYDPAQNTWTVITPGGASFIPEAGVVQLSSNNIFAFGIDEHGSPQTSILDAAALDWSAPPNKYGYGANLPAVSLPGDRLFGTGLPWVAMFDEATNTWTELAKAPFGSEYADPPLLTPWNQVFFGIGSYDVAKDVWTKYPRGDDNPWTRYPGLRLGPGETYVTLNNGTVLATGGADSPGGPNISENCLGIFAPHNYVLELARGSHCAAPAECRSGNCVGGVCCATPCIGACETCSMQAGAVEDGICGPATGPMCVAQDYGCTLNGSGICQTGKCERSDGLCTPPPASSTSGAGDSSSVGGTTTGNAGCACAVPADPAPAMPSLLSFVVVAIAAQLRRRFEVA